MVYSDRFSAYITGLFAEEDEPLRLARTESTARGLPPIHIQPEEGRFLQLLAAASGGRKAIEIGALGGYSGIWIARGLAGDGKLITLEVQPAHAAVAQENFDRAGISSRVEIIIGDARQTLPGLAARGPFDFVFIDADKTSYAFYYEWAVANTRSGGIITAHNAFRHGGVLAPVTPEDVAQAAFNRMVAADDRVRASIFPAGDGLVVAVKR